MRRRWNCCGCWGRYLIALGVGIILALVMPVSAIIFVAGLSLILLGTTILR
ncbi:MAG: hypothetical protein MJ077_02500 [Oscillospiraceae bacterium]|nr:hypothetical protein [Oscillospiraceae bacterium]